MSSSNSSKEVLASITEAREILESVGETCPVYVGFEKDQYVLTGQQLQKIARALYLADCELFEDLDDGQPI